jgi:hypothetical protein
MSVRKNAIKKGCAFFNSVFSKPFFKKIDLTTNILPIQKVIFEKNAFFNGF